MSDPFTRPKVRKVTVEIEGEDGKLARFTYYDQTAEDRERRAPRTPQTGIELQIGTETHREVDERDPFAVLPPRIRTVRYVHTLRIESSPSWTVETVFPPPGDVDGEVVTGELAAAPAALEAPRG